MISFVVQMEPVAWGRVKTGRYGQSYVPNKTRHFERDFAKASAIHKPAQPLDGPLELTVLFQIEKPKSVRRTLPSVRPDLDNYVKAVTDSLNGLFWKDDAQIVRLYARKRYGDRALIAIQIDRSTALNAVEIDERQENDQRPQGMDSDAS